MVANACVGKTARQINPKKARVISDSKLDMGQSVIVVDHFGPNVLGGIRYTESDVFFEDIKGFEDFKIHVDGLILDSQIPRNLRTIYYKLCCGQKMFLHDHLTKGLSCKLAVAIISETIVIADSIRLVVITTPPHHLECWERTLKAFEDLGMSVRFLRNRLSKLFTLSHEYQATIESKRMKRARADEAISNLEATSLKVKAFVGSLEAEIEALSLKIERLSFEFQGLAQTPW